MTDLMVSVRMMCLCKPPEWPKWNDALDRPEHEPSCPRSDDEVPVPPSANGEAPLEPLPSFDLDAPRRVPVTRTDIDLLTSIAQLLEEVLAVQRHLLAAATKAPSESRSSAAVKTSARGYDVEAKSYGEGLLDDAMDDAIANFARAQVKLAELQMNGWRETVSRLESESSAALHGAEVSR